MKPKINIFWFRRDLRLYDNAGLFFALKSKLPVLCIFIFDKNILDKLNNKTDARVQFIHHQINLLNQQLIQKGSSLFTYYGEPTAVFKELLNTYTVDGIYTNHDYEPYAKERDDQIKKIAGSGKVTFNSYKDQVVFEKSEIVKDNNLPYTVFTHYKNKFLKKLSEEHTKQYKCTFNKENLFQSKPESILTLKKIGFFETDQKFPSQKISDDIIKDYQINRDYPGINGTTRLSVHLRFGTLSIRELFNKSLELKSNVWLNELIWREFYHMILWNFPHVTKGAFKKQYNKIKWRNNENEFNKWCNGLTGYPIVDAGMRELNNTGFMHNRVRMITASFLVKHLLIDWRWGEAYFAEKLLDFDLAANNGGWQWAAGTGCDAAPYFRIFNPYTQTKNFDSNFKYIRKWVPEYDQLEYPSPIVEHKMARERCLKAYKTALADN